MEGSAATMESMNNSRNDPQMSNLCDLVLIVNGKRFRCHRAVLASASHVFTAMFTNGMRESDSREVTLREVNDVVWGLVLDFLYTGKLASVKSVDTAVEIVECARRFEFTTLAKTALDEFVYTFVMHRIHCWAVLKRAFQQNIEDLQFNAASHIKKYVFAQDWMTKPFFWLDAELVEFLVSSDDLRVGCELTVYKAIQFWLTGSGIDWDDEKPRIEKICYDRQLNHQDLFEHVNMEKMHIEELKEIGKTAKSLNYSFWGSAVDKILATPLQGLHRCAVDKSHFLARSRTLVEPVTFTHRIYGVSKLERKRTTRSPWVDDEVSRVKFRLEIELGDTINFRLHAPGAFWNYFGRVQFFTLKCGHAQASDVTLVCRWERTQGEPVTGIIDKSLSELQAPENQYLDFVDDSITVGVTIYLH